MWKKMTILGEFPAHVFHTNRRGLISTVLSAVNRPPTSGEERPRSVVLKDKYTKELIYRHSIHWASSLTADCFDGAAVQDDIKGTEAIQGILKKFPTFIQVTSTNLRKSEDKNVLFR
jgi:hypothetical protein